MSDILLQRSVLRYVSDNGVGTEVAGITLTIPCYCVSRFGDNARCPKHGDSGLKHNVEKRKP